MREMKFTRRFILGGSLVTVTALHLSGCAAPDTGYVEFDQDGQFFSSTELSRLNDAAEQMIPRTDTAGAADAEVAAIVDGLMMSWAIAPTRRQFQRAIAQVDALALQDFGKPYASLVQGDRFALVDRMDRAAFSEMPPEWASDYKRLKELVFRVFYSSEDASANHVPVPGAYFGDLSLEDYDALQEERAYGR